MATVEDLDRVIKRCQQAMREFGKGNPELMKGIYSHREDVTRVITPELAYVVWVERHRSKIGERRDPVLPLESDDNLPSGGRHLEDRAPAHGHGDHAPAA